MQFSNLLGEVGGTLGLWIGISALTMIEVAQLIVVLGRNVAEKYREKRRIHVATAGNKNVEMTAG